MPQFTDSDFPARTQAPVLHGSPVRASGGEPRVAMYTPDFSADPHRAYADMRQRYGSLVPVELSPGVPATLVIGYRTALQILNDPDRFPADPRAWQQNVPGECPVRPVLEWQPTAMYNTGVDHQRYRNAVVAALDTVDLHAVHAMVGYLAEPLIDGFCEAGAADLVTDYAFPLVTSVLDQLIGCPAELGLRVANGMAACFDTARAAQGLAQAREALTELVYLKRTDPGDDITTHLINSPAEFTDEEVAAQLVSFYSSGVPAQCNLAVNTVLLMLTDERFGGGLFSGALSTRDALDEVLFNDPPLANFCITYPKQPTVVEDTWLPAHQPVVISLAGCNTDPAIDKGERFGNRAHMAWSTGLHACPARELAYLVVQDAVDELLDIVPDLRLSIDPEELVWRTGPFHRSLVSLPVTFEPVPKTGLDR
ncbi:cytochrome P450 [Nocardia veterana]|uniref:Cytochrome P450 n=1 Tax=Nocardia veterana TaxID=132249 RepID=A0A7X6RHR1_9NOCA|nr:cytochrome P450 [Nocardia veterana]NKY86361.1 cytochrome P450 [Nocardia veterana]